MNIFGRKKPEVKRAIDPEVISKTTMSLKQTLDTLEKRQGLLEKKIQQQVAEARKKSAAKDQKGALFCLKRKKLYEKEISKIDGARINIEQQIITLEGTMTNVAVVEGMKVGRDTLRAVHATVTVEDTDELMDDISEEMAAADDFSTAISQPIGGSMFDDAELTSELEELEGLMMEEDMLSVPSIAAPSAGVKAPAGRAAVAAPAASAPAFELPSAPAGKVTVPEDPDMAELKALEAEFA